MTQFCYYFQLLIHICKAKTKKGENKTKQIKVLCEQTRELTHDFLDYV